MDNKQTKKEIKEFKTSIKKEIKEIRLQTAKGLLEIHKETNEKINALQKQINENRVVIMTFIKTLDELYEKEKKEITKASLNDKKSKK